MSIAATTTMPQYRALGLVSSAHFMSHFYGMTLPPLFIAIHNDVGISFTLLGLLLSIQQITSGALQLPVGIAVDRYGAKPLMLGGLALVTFGIGMIAFTDSYIVLMALFLLYGIGNSVFHPADYNILNSTMNESHMGRAFSIHTFCGHIGTAIAPVTMLTITEYYGWRTALMFSGALGLTVLLFVMTQWQILKDDAPTPKKKKKQADPNAPGESMSTKELLLHILRSPAILYLFIFFCVSSLAGSGLRNFAIPGLVELHGTAESMAGGAISGFLFASAFGVLLGGWIADKTSRHEVVAAISLTIAAVLVVLIGSVNLHALLLVGTFTVVGLVQGIIRPARDMMIRNAAPKGAQGRVFGFVFSGQSFGGGISPLLFGVFLDLGMPMWIFYTGAFFMIVCMAVMVLSARSSRREAAVTAAAAGE